MFIDEVTVYVRAGDGGNGCLSFHHEKFAARGGPDGGDGGRGGHIIVGAKAGVKTLMDLKMHPHHKAPRGHHGEGDRRHGANGADTALLVPPGTTVMDADSGEILADLTEPGQAVIVARGGRGGRGNARFTSSTRQSPHFSEKGEPGEDRTLLLTLRLLADVGLVGYPNVGKSSLIARVSAAKPKIADYPFTTLVPNLGMVRLDHETSFVVADVPGIVEGAHQGVGLGVNFLKHVQRTVVLVHVLDMAALEGRPPVADFHTLKKELGAFDPRLLERPQVIAPNKMDLPEARENLALYRRDLERTGLPVFPISAATGEGTGALMKALAALVKSSEPRTVRAPVTFRPPAPKPSAPRIAKEGSDFVIAWPEAEKLVRMTDLTNPEGVAHLQRQLEHLGLPRALREHGVQPGDGVRLGEYWFTFVE